MEPTIILIGQTGAGKSQFIRVAAGIPSSNRGPPRVGHGVTSETETVEVFPAKNSNHPGSSVRLIDTPGFNDSGGKGDDMVIQKIIQWLKKEPTARIQGVLYLHEITQIRAINAAIVKPKDIPQPPGIFIVTTKWSTAEKAPRKLAEEARREEELRKELNFPPQSMYRFKNTNQSAWDIIAAVQALPANVTHQELAEGLERICPQFHIKQQKKSFMKTLANMFRNMFK